MQTICPRCEQVLAAGRPECPNCKYQWTVECELCGKKNAHYSSFCGGCGQGLNWKIRFEQRLHKYVPQSRTLQAKDAVAGFIFGSILFFFAFGTMGMTNSSFSHVEPAVQSAKGKNPFASPPAKQAFNSLKTLDSEEKRHRNATHADLVRIGNILIETFSPVIDPDGKNPQRQALADSLRYLQSLENSDENLTDIPLRRSDVAIFLYRLIGDLFAENEVANIAGNKYADLPRYHYMNLPVEMLDNLGVHLSREERLFGGDDVVSVEWLSGLSIDLVRSCEKKLKEKVFPGLQTSN